MTDAFTVETIDLDLPPLVGAFSRRLHEAGLPITPARSADFARALILVRPISRRRLYWTARGVFVSDPAQVKDFDAVFFSVFGHGSSETFDPENARTSAQDDRPRSDNEGSPRGSAAHDSRGVLTTAGESKAEDDRAEVEMPLAMASDEELLRSKSFDALEPH